MKRLVRTVILSAALLVSFVVGNVHANVTYSGTLSYANGGIVGLTENNSNAWLAVGTELDWRVTDDQQGSYTYWYQLTVPEKDISHFCIEASDNFTMDNILGVLQGNLASDQPQTHDSTKNANTGMPSDMFGIKFENPDALSWTVEFTSDRRPMWGDFYAVGSKKPGKTVAIWNSGFDDPDSDPHPDGPGPGAGLTDHLLVPDTIGGDDDPPLPPNPPVPAPGALILAAIGVGLVRVRQRML